MGKDHVHPVIMHRYGRKANLLGYLAEIWPKMTRDDIYVAIMCGEVKVDGAVERDPKVQVSVLSHFQHEPAQFVGRGGLKLDAVLEEMNLRPADQVCLDAGSSTGGFTDCLLRRGARHVHAVDVGFNQLAWKLRIDSRVSVHEKKNIMDVFSEDLVPPVEMAVSDLSFRSLRKVASRLLLLTGGGPVLSLVKPQFERPSETGFNGIVKTSQARRDAIWMLKKDLLKENVYVLDGIVSPITGRKGNPEIFLLLSNSNPPDENYVNSRIALALDEADNLGVCRT